MNTIVLFNAELMLAIELPIEYISTENQGREVYSYVKENLLLFFNTDRDRLAKDWDYVSNKVFTNWKSFEQFKLVPLER